MALFAQFAAVAKSLAHAHRLELLEQLAQGERSVEVLAERTGLSVANASQHLQQMRRAGIVATRREGKFIFCTLADEAVLDLSFPKIPSERIRAMRENQSIIRRDACHPLSAWDVCRQPVHVAAPA